MPLNYIGSKNNNSAGLRILHITLAFRIIWHRKNPNVTVRICLIFLHRTSLVDMTCFLLNMKIMFVPPFGSWLKRSSYVLKTTLWLTPLIYFPMIATTSLELLLQNSNRWFSNNDPNHRLFSRSYFGHNTNTWTAASCIKEGLIRPSAVDFTDSTWIAAVGFYAQGVLGVRNVTDRSLTDVLLRAQKYANYGTDRPICLVGLTAGRQTHATIHQGGVVSEHCANLFCDIVHSQKEKRWALRSHMSRLTHFAVLLPPNL